MIDYHDFHSQVYSQDSHLPKGNGYGWVQWKGTNVCMDIHCGCGYHGHVDADFFYFYRCPKCSKLFAVGQVVNMIALTPEQVEFVENDRPNLIMTCDLEDSEKGGEQ